jgi:transcriptional regulator with XRE-family HTH domain
LRRRRTERGYSQEELAHRADLHRTEIGLLERGQREPKLGVITKLAGALAVSPNVLFEGLEFIPSENGQGHFSYAPREGETGR